jgi:hypothetical protein
MPQPEPQQSSTAGGLGPRRARPAAAIPSSAVRLAVVLCVVVGLAACSSEEATPVELSTSTSTTAAADPGTGSTDGTLPPTPHAVGENPQARAYAEQQCLDDPSLEQGTIRIVDPTTQTVVGEVVVACDEVRSASSVPAPGP